MFNLLPKAEKEFIRREYRLRLVVVWLCFLLVTIVGASLFLAPSYIVSVQKEKDAKYRLEIIVRNGSHGEAVSFGTVLKSAQEKLKLASARQKPNQYIFERIVAIAREKPARISINGFSVTLDDNGKTVFFLSGVASERNSLVSFTQSLKQKGIFEEIEVPLSLLAKESGIEFNLRATGAF